MGTKWLAALPLLVGFNMVITQPLTREARQLDLKDCCPCPDPTISSPDGRSGDGSPAGPPAWPCPCQRDADDAEASASIFRPALRAMQPFVKQPDSKMEPKPLLQPEVGLASSVLETLRQATDEEYQEARARDAARTAVKLIESTLDPLGDTLMDSPINKVKIFLNPKYDGDDMDDNLPEPSHVQETRCIHSPLTRTLAVSRPAPIVELIEAPQKPFRKLNHKNVLHRKFQDMDNGISASNINERIAPSESDHDMERLCLETNTRLSSSPFNNFKKSDNLKGSKKYISNDSNQSETIKPKLNTKLRELLDNIEKAKASFIDLNKYVSPIARIPSLQRSPIGKPINNSRQVLLKDLLKLKDVELIPPRSLTKTATKEKPSYPSLKLQAETFKADIDNCKDSGSNITPLLNTDDEIPANPVFDDDISDTDTSPTNSNPVFELKGNEMDVNENEDLINVESMTSAENNALSIISTDVEDQDNIHQIETKQEDDSNQEQLSSDNCKATGDSFIPPLVENEDIKKMKGNENQSELNNRTFQITYLEDFDMPIVFDNSSFAANSDSKDDDNVSRDQDTLTDTNNNAQDQEIRKQLSIDCDSQDLASAATELFSDENEDPNLINFRDLQDMSDSILTLSECDPPKEDNNKNVYENIYQDNDDHDMQNIPTTGFDTNSQEMGTLNDSDLSSGVNNERNDESDANSIERLYDSTEFDETTSNIKQDDAKKNTPINPDIESNEMRAEASAPQSNLYECVNPVFESNAKSKKNSVIFPKNVADIQDNTKIDKNSIFLNNLKSKLADLFTTTEKVTDNLNISDDNGNESSNVNPVVARSRVGNSKPLDNLQQAPQTLLPKITLPEFPRTPLKSFKDTLLLPSNFDESNDLFNFFNVPKSIDNTLDHSAIITALSDKLRSHTEDTIKNVKETLESTWKEAPSLRLANPTDRIDIHDALESISSRRDDMKDKLEAIHLDLNDRFSSFQQSVLDHFKTPPGRNSVSQKGSNNGVFSMSPVPLRQELPLSAPSNLRAVKHDQSLMPHRVNIPKKGKNTEIKITPHKTPEVSDKPGFRYSDRTLQKARSFSTTTPVPVLVGSKVLKTGVPPRLPSEFLSKLQKPKMGLAEAGRIMNPLSLKSQRTGNHLEQPQSPVKSVKTHIEKINEDNLSTESPVSKFKKTLQNTRNQKLRNELKKSLERGTGDALRNSGRTDRERESSASRVHDGRPRLGSRHDGPLASATTQMESGLKVVEPLRENVPYKCKLICYKDS